MRSLRKLRAFHAKVARRRKDAKHKMTLKVVRSCDVLYLEDFRTKNLTASARGTIGEPGTNIAQKSGLNRSVLNVAPGETRLQVEYKMRRKGGAVYYVNPAYTSRRRSACGHTEAGNRPDRDAFKCLSCGHAACADHNAALTFCIWAARPEPEDIRGWPAERIPSGIGNRKKTVLTKPRKRLGQDREPGPSGPGEVIRFRSACRACRNACSGHGDRRRACCR